MKLVKDKLYSKNEDVSVTLNAVIDGICETTQRIELDNLMAILLVGSTARGEFSGYIKDDKIFSFSDIEFVFITKNGRANSSLLDSEFKSLLNCYFHKSGFEGVDYWPMSISKFTKETTLFFHEARVKGKLIYCEPTVEYQLNLGQSETFLANKVDLVEICLHRSINMLSNIYKHDELSSLLSLAISRNYLDLLSVFMYWNGINIVGYDERCKHFLTLENIKHPFSKNFSHDIELATKHKISPYLFSIGNQNIERISRYVCDLKRLVDYLTKSLNKEKLESCDINNHGRRLFAYHLFRYISDFRKYRLKAVMSDAKPQLLYEVINRLEMKAMGNPSFDSIEQRTKSAFGLKLKYESFQPAFDDICAFNYPYLVRKNES